MFLTCKMGVINLFLGILFPNIGCVPAAFANASVGTAHSQRCGFRRFSATVFMELYTPVSLRGSVPGWVP